MKRAVVVLAIAAAGCGGRTPNTPGSGSGSGSVSGSETPSPKPEARSPRGPFHVDAPELITGIIDDWSSTTVTLQRWERTDHGWQADQDAWPGVIGSAGAAWGEGLHGSGAPSGRTGPVKREGDKAAPAGAFALRKAYGYSLGGQSQLGYTSTGNASSHWECVDDPASSHYTEILDRDKVTTVDWKTSEQMHRDDELYTWVIDVAHNPLARPGVGSCIFFHVWSAGEHKPTIGCTAMAEPKLARLVGEIDANTVYVLLPRAEYAALAHPWGLPPQ